MTLMVMSNVLLSHVRQKEWLLGPWGLHFVFSACCLPLIPEQCEGLGQATVLHMAGVGGSVLRGDSHHHPGLVSALSTGENASLQLQLLHLPSPSPVQTNSLWVEVIGQTLEGPVLSWGHVAGGCHGGRLCEGTDVDVEGVL